MNYNTIVSSDKLKCLLLCNHIGLSKAVCDQVCDSQASIESEHNQKEINKAEVAVDNIEKQNFKEGCIGNGREICYKSCRLHKKESIKTCLCACCDCKF